MNLAPPRWRKNWWAEPTLRVLLLLLLALPALADQPRDNAPDGETARIQKLIAQLGDKNYSTREKAQAELARLGLAAFDALLDAQESDNVEVALRSRYLVRGMNIGWVREDDPPEVKAILRGYEAADNDHRRSILDRLSMEDNYIGVEALCRLSRFETNEMLSKKAALLVMLQTPPTEKEALDQYTDSIKSAVGMSHRIGAEWLRTYLATLDAQPDALAKLDALTQQEQETFTLMPDKSSKEIVGDLLLWQAGVLRDLGKKDEAFTVIVRRLDLLDEGRTDIMATLDWLINRQAWTLIDEVHNRFATRFDSDAEFLYRLAEARQKQGRVEAGETLAKRAFDLNTEDSREHKRLGLVLQTRGMFDWAEREYRYSITQGPPGSIAHVEATLYLSEMLHDVQRDIDAAASLQELVDLAAKDDTVKQQLIRRRGSVGPVESRMHFFYAEHYGQSDEPKKQVEHLEKAVEADPTDADVLIGLFRAPTDAELRERTQLLIRQAAAQFQQQIELFNRQVEEAHDEEFRQWASARLASLYNQYAWLVGNTEGDFDSALRYSHRTLELRPGTAGYLDTLGRCYYAKGDYANAVKYQTQAVKRDPYSGAIQRQLALFERALANEQK
jgi:tetratricopeptide (TPR) repeat protein